MSSKLSIGQKFFSHGGIYAVSQFANRGIGLILIPLYAHLLTKEEFGIISLLAVTGAVFVALFFQGQNAAWFRLRFDRKSKEDLRRFESTVFYYLVTSGLFVLCLISFFGDEVARIISSDLPYFPLIFLTAVSSFSAIFSMLFLAKVQAEQRPLAYAVFSFIKTGSTLLTVVLFVAGLKMGALGKIGAEAFVSFIMAVVAIILIRPGGIQQFSKPIMKRCLTYGLPLVPHALLGHLNTITGRLLITHYLGFATTGVYSMGHQIAALGSVLGNSLNQAFAPLFIREVKNSEKLLADGKVESAKQTLQKVSDLGLLMVTASSCIALFLTGFVREVLIILTTPSYNDSWMVVAPVAASTVAHVTYFVSTHSIAFKIKGVRLMPLITFLTILTNLGTNILLLPRIGFMGSAWAMLASSIVMALSAFLIGRHFVRLPYHFSRWFGVYLFTGLGLFTLFFFDSEFDSLLPRLLAKLAVVAISCLFVMKSAHLSIHNFINLYKNLTVHKK